MPDFTTLHIQAPGRVCLFGDHQDYLGYPVVAAAINKYIYIHAKPLLSQADSVLQIQMPDLMANREKFYPILPQDQKLPYLNSRDYLASGINVARQEGAKWSNGWEVTITGDIPINAGASSSSALVIGWLYFLLQSGGVQFSSDLLGRLGYQTEVAEFNEAGGMMDHFASAYGNIVSVGSRPQFYAKYLKNPIRGLVLANSGVKKNTVDDLRNTKNRALRAYEQLKEIFPEFDPFHSSLHEVQQFLPSLNLPERLIAEGNLRNRDITREGTLMLESNRTFTDQQASVFGGLMSEHHQLLAEKIKISIPEIEQMVEMAKDAGALGVKINGSGFGGTIVAYSPKNSEKLVDVFTQEGYDAWAVEISPGAQMN